MSKRRKTWYAASVILFFRLKKGAQRSFPVLENVYLVKAKSVEEARARAEDLGRAEEQELEMNGKPAELVFGGVRKVRWCATDPSSAEPTQEASAAILSSGVEATYSSFVVKGKAALRALISGKRVSVVYDEM